MVRGLAAATEQPSTVARCEAIAYRLAAWTSRNARSRRSDEHCEECGAKLTERELQLVLESGGPALCTIHAAEVAELDNPELDDGAAY